jgi:DNA-binding GntR family transcriptional regulator
MDGTSRRKAERAPLTIGRSGRDGGLPLSEAVFRALCQALRNGIYRPGDRLREEEVAQRLEVSRTPVREAFGRLLAKGLVAPAGAKGLIVRSLDSAEILELYAMREILEGAATRLAAQHASAPEIDALRDLEAAFEAHAHDPREMARLNRLFHETLFRAARNRYLDVALQEMQDAIALLGATTFSVEGRARTAVREHQEIIAAIAARDADRAEQSARAHIRESLRARLRLLQG